MKRSIKGTSAGIILFSALLGFVQTVQAHECSLRNVRGSYGYTSSGSIVTPAVGPFNAVGQVTFTDSGTFTGAQMTSFAGTLVAETVSGTFTVNPDCTGTATVYVYHGSTLARTSSIQLVWDLDQSEARAIFLTAGTSITINARRISRDHED